MARVGFCINGFDGDQRDFFPFEFVAVDPAFQQQEYVTTLDFITAFDYIHKMRRLRVAIDITLFDDTLGTPANLNVTYSQNADRIGTAILPGEQGIFESFNTNDEWPDWTYDSGVLSPLDPGGFDSSISVSYGSTTNVPLVYIEDEVFGSLLEIHMTIAGGDTGDRGEIAMFSTIPDTGYVVSAVDCAFLGKPFLLYRNTNAPWNRDASGTIRITATNYWDYNGIWSSTDGSQLIIPVPEDAST